jgi:transcriptional regulator with XRE-family HTH domain
MTPVELRDRRLALGWSQEEAAERLGVGLRTFKYMEAGGDVRREATRIDPVPKTVALAMLAYRFAQHVEVAKHELGHDLIALGDEIEHLARDFAAEIQPSQPLRRSRLSR